MLSVEHDLPKVTEKGNQRFHPTTPDSRAKILPICLLKKKKLHKGKKFHLNSFKNIMILSTFPSPSSFIIFKIFPL